MRLTVLVLLLVLAQAASAGVIYEFYGFRNDTIQTFTLELPDFFPGAVNENVIYTPGVDNLICNSCTTVRLMHFLGTSWANDEVWYSDAYATNMFYFPWWSFMAVGTYDSEWEDAILTVRRGEIQQGPASRSPAPWP